MESPHEVILKKTPLALLKEVLSPETPKTPKNTITARRLDIVAQPETSDGNK